MLNKIIDKRITAMVVNTRAIYHPSPWYFVILRVLSCVFTVS